MRVSEEEFAVIKSRLDNLRNPVKQVIVDDRDLSEKLFQQKIINLAKANGWLVYHTHDSRRSEPGFPDLVMVRNCVLIFAEVKTLKGKISTEQERWLYELSETETPTYIWRPSDWPEIERILEQEGRQ